MAHVRFTRNLSRFFPALGDCQVDGVSVAEIIRALEKSHPGLAGYLVEDDGSLRKHVNIFVDESALRDRRGLADPVGPASRLYVVQALSGG